MWTWKNGGETQTLSRNLIFCFEKIRNCPSRSGSKIIDFAKSFWSAQFLSIVIGSIAIEFSGRTNFFVNFYWICKIWRKVWKKKTWNCISHNSLELINSYKRERDCERKKILKNYEKNLRKKVKKIFFQKKIFSSWKSLSSRLIKKSKKKFFFEKSALSLWSVTAER